MCVTTPVKRAPADIPMKNFGKDCAEHCPKSFTGEITPGPCEFCGRGLCCAKGISGNGCDGDTGGKKQSSKQNYTCVPGPPPLHPVGRSEANRQGLFPGAEIMVVNGDSKRFRMKSSSVLEQLINSRESSTLYVMGPPSKIQECSDPQRNCDMEAERSGKFQPDGCRDQSGCDSDQICCCQMKLRNLPCHEDEYKAPSTASGQTVCTLDSETVRTTNVLGSVGNDGWSSMNFMY